jgi:5-methylthioadenosine/S-adenosylhomocysteine deaminase
MKADLSIFNTCGPHWQPKHDAVGVLVYSAQSADVQTTIVDGKILYHKGEFTTIDIERAVAETSTRGLRLVQP